MPSKFKNCLLSLLLGNDVKAPIVSMQISNKPQSFEHILINFGHSGSHKVGQINCYIGPIDECLSFDTFQFKLEILKLIRERPKAQILFFNFNVKLPML